MIDALLSWLPAYLLHSSVLLGGLWLLERAGALAGLAPRGREGLWRAALLGGVVSASVMVTAKLPNDLPASPAATAAIPVPTVNRALSSPASPTPTPAAVQRMDPIEPEQNPSGPPARTPGWRESLVALAALWLLGAIGGLASLAAQWLALRRALTRLPRVQDRRWLHLAEQAAAAHDLATPKLRHSAAWASPLLAPGRTICLPDWALTLDDTAARAVLGHELAHLRRHDPAWRLLGEALRRVLWLQPLNALALRRLDLLAELACDAAAAARPAERAALAASLLRCAEQQRPGPLPRLACSIGGPLSPLALRVRHLLAGPSAPPPGAGKVRRALILAGLTLAVLAVPMVVVRHSDARGLLDRLDLPAFSELSFGSDHDGRTTRIRSIHAGGKFSVDLKGEVGFNADETEIERVTGRLIVSERQGGLTREMRLSPNPEGQLQREYRRNGKPADMDEDARNWWQVVVPRLAEAVITPQDRARRLLAQGGLEAVLLDLDKQPRDDFRRLAPR